jgi:hypothetical protein
MNYALQIALSPCQGGYSEQYATHQNYRPADLKDAIDSLLLLWIGDPGNDAASGNYEECARGDHDQVVN